MFFRVIPLAALLVVVFYFRFWKRWRDSMNGQSWNSLIARLEPDWSVRELGDRFPWEEELNSTPEETWDRLKGIRGLWAMYRNAGIMLAMAKFADGNGASIDPHLLEDLRNDVQRVQIVILTIIDQYAFSEAVEGIRLNAHCVAVIYTSLAARMMRILQTYAAAAVPDFVAAI